MQNYEVEIKSLLGSEESAAAMRKKMQKIDPSTKLVSRNKQLNHYFTGGAMAALVKTMEGHLSFAVLKKLNDLITRVTEISVRTRNKDGTVYLVVKASVGDDTSANGVARMEFEERVDLTLEQLDRLLLKAGFRYQAKWSREREEYVCKGTNVCLDKNAGYGWLAEFERMVPNEDLLAQARSKIIQLMQECGVEELPQDRLERMFVYYNAHWPEYYGTEKIFTVN
ncbi:MAG: CYTH domain-containing protein [Candidatus Adlerbacteria bacterium]|nr:CYTH domain-containing protein [Candidatus Adlerbacteria bacterium]